MSSNINTIIFPYDKHFKYRVFLDIFYSFSVGNKCKIMAVTLKYSITRFESCSESWSIYIEFSDINSSFRKLLRRLCMILIDTTCNGESSLENLDSSTWINLGFFDNFYRDLSRKLFRLKVSDKIGTYITII